MLERSSDRFVPSFMRIPMLSAKPAEYIIRRHETAGPISGPGARYRCRGCGCSIVIHPVAPVVVGRDHRREQNDLNARDVADRMRITFDSKKA